MRGSSCTDPTSAKSEKSFCRAGRCFALKHTHQWRQIMAAHCQVTGAEPGFGHSISHSHRRNKRRFDPNIQKKRYWVPSLRRNVTLQVSARGIKTIDVRGIDAVVTEILARGVKL
ncbi:LSU ribosomal protein L28P [Renibacterium salmoninarum ATCC 33209]|uniref:Large ribosomal subunit protein bL28 n=3 Tax=Micrococcaceae TaxID=1268 RepID=A9WTS7_RENSM|nr:LSU ribosomal protein L28P [Renibacterium salmoninarum ATCC 33209]